VQDSFLRQGKLGLMTVCRNDNRWDSSNVEFVDGEILTYNKKLRNERMRHIDYGLGVFRKAAFGLKGQARDLAMLYQELLGERELAAFEVSGRFYEIGSFAGIQEIGAYLNQQSTMEPK
jgi:hypothetical protein